MGIEDHNYDFNFSIIADGINNPKNRLIYDEVLVLIGAITLLALLILGFCRRYSSSVFIKFPVDVADAMSYTLVSYTIGLMQSSTFGNNLFVVWATCLVLVLGSADSISAFSLQDGSKWKKLYISLMVQMFWVGWLWGTYIHKHSPFKIPIGLLIMACVYKTNFRIETLQWVSGSDEGCLSRKIKRVADYMHFEDEFRNGDAVDPRRMTGYNYLVSGENKLMSKPTPPEYLICVDRNQFNQVITLDKIWRCQRILVNSEGDEKLKDICLSYALAKLLCRRFFDYELAEKDLPKTKDLVLRGLLSQNADDPERAFRVIEAELSFIYDIFYTKYPLIYHKNHWPKLLSLLSAIPLLWLAGLLLESYNKPNNDLTLIKGHRKNYDALLTFVLVIIILLFECLQFYFYFASDWVKVSLVCNYVPKPTCQATLCRERIIRFPCRLKIFKHSLEKIIRFVCLFKNLKKYWKQKLSQYSLLDSFHYNPKRNFVSWLSDKLIDKRRQGQKEDDEINLSTTVKKAIIHSLKISNGRLSNGKASLERNEAAQLSEACNHRNHAQSILIWHIATTLCMQHSLNEREKKNKGEDNKGGLGDCLRKTLLVCFKRVTFFCKRNCSRHINKFIGDDYEIAISLSNYCAYLVAFAPKFLPDHSCATEMIFDEVIKEANELLGGLKCMPKIHEKMMSMGEAADIILKKGALLGKKLINEIENEKKRWKVLADYWAEMILFLAPSNNATVHLEKLTEGGELITHLWALLTHAGIVEREAVVSTA